MMTFIQTIASHALRGMTAQKYHDNVNALISIRLEPDLSLCDAASKSWSEIDDRRYEFGLPEKQVELLQEMIRKTAIDVPSVLSQGSMAYFADALFVSSPRLLIVHSSLDGTVTSEMTESLTESFRGMTLKIAESVESVRDGLSLF